MGDGRKFDPNSNAPVIAIVLIACLILYSGFILFKAIIQNNEANMVESVGTGQPVSNAQICAHLYNVDKHEAWAECMGVGYQHNRSAP